MKSGIYLRQLINRINEEVDFIDANQKHAFNELYEGMLKDLQSAGRAGEYYTPRAVTNFVVEKVNPKLGETVLDPAFRKNLHYGRLEHHADFHKRLGEKAFALPACHDEFNPA